jgi:hypothetical protein
MTLFSHDDDPDDPKIFIKKRPLSPQAQAVKDAAMTTQPPDFKALCAELVAAYDSYSYADGGDAADRMKDAIDAARAALNAPPLAPIEPNTDQVLRLAAIIRKVDGSHRLGAAALAEAILSHLAPIPVSERLPGPEDCDDQGRCWLHFLLGDDPTWTLEHYTSALCSGRSHWLPAWAIPLPEVQE